MDAAVPPILLKNLERLTSREACQRGLDLFTEGAVLDVRRTGRSFEFRVANDRAGFALTRITFGTQQLSAQCNCHQPQRFCEHAVASLFQLSRDAPSYTDFLTAAELRPECLPGTVACPIDPEPGRDAFTANGTASAQRRDLPELLSPEGRETDLRLRIPEPLTTMSSRWHRVNVMPQLRFRTRPYSATNVKRLVEAGQASGGMRLEDFTPQQQQILRFLARQTEWHGNLFQLSAYELADLFHCLIGFPFVHVGGKRLVVHGERLEPVLLASASDGGATVRPRLRLPDRGSLPSRQLSYIVGRGGYWIGLGLEYWWLAGTMTPAWLLLFMDGKATRLSEEELERLAERCSRGLIPAAIAPDRDVPAVFGHEGQCTPVLSLHWQNTTLSATLGFDYDGRVIGSHDPHLLWQRNRFVARDDVAERSAVNRLTEVGFRRHPRGPDRIELKGAQKIWRFLDQHLDELTPTWRIYWTSDFLDRRAESGALALSVAPGKETPSWFEVECRLRAPDGSPLAWQSLVNAARQHRSCLYTGTGAVMTLPDELRQTLLLLDRRASSQQDNVLRFGTYSAIAISAAVLPYLEPGRAKKWQRLHERLSRPHSPSPVHLPPELSRRLRDYQMDGVTWLKLLEVCGVHGILADEMGLGKTIQALAYITARRLERPNAKPALIVCPTSLVENWLIEASRFTPQLRRTAVRGNDRQAQIHQIDQADLVVTSYALLRRDVEAYSKHQFDTLVLDEAQHIKNPQTANARTCKALRAERRIILTGTPVENSLAEVWSLFDFLLPGLLGSRQEFRQCVEVPANSGDRDRVTAEVARQIRPFILRRTKDQVCRELPPKIEQVVCCELEDRQRQLYDGLLLTGRQLLNEAKRDGWNSRRFEVLSLIMRLRQVCCHPNLLPAEMRVGYPEDGPSAKTELAREIVMEALDDDHRILFFSQFTGVLGLFRTWLEDSGIRYEYLDGSTKDRQQRVDRFNEDTGIPLFLLSLRAGGTGLNLTGADTVIHYDQWWNPMVEDQATDRTHRIGQSRPVTSLKLVVRHTIEERILDLQDSKRQLFQQLLEGVPTNLGELNPEDIEVLLEPETPTC